MWWLTTGASGVLTLQSQAHNLGVPPEMIIISKRRNSAQATGMPYTIVQLEFICRLTGLNDGGNLTYYLFLTQFWNSTTPTDSVISLGTQATFSTSGETYIYLPLRHTSRSK